MTLREKGGESGLREERRVRRDEGREISGERHRIFMDKEEGGRKVSNFMYLTVIFLICTNTNTFSIFIPLCIFFI